MDESQAAGDSLFQVLEETSAHGDIGRLESAAIADKIEAALSPQLSAQQLGEHVL